MINDAKPLLSRIFARDNDAEQQPGKRSTVVQVTEQGLSDREDGIADQPGGAGGGRERRQSERALVAWEAKLSELGRNPSLTELFATVDTEEWSYGFVVAVDPVAEVSSILTYGSHFARLLGLPPKGVPFVRMSRQLPRPYPDIFLQGCTQACDRKEPVHSEGEVEREDGKRELYRAVFIPIEHETDSLARYAFGRFNSRVIEDAA